MHHGYSRFLREDDKIDPIIKYFAHEQQSYELLRWAIKDSRTKGFHSHEITVLFPSAKTTDLEPLQYGGTRLAPYSIGEKLSPDRDAWYSTIRRFKGLESSAVILIGLSDLLSDEGADLFYTACTRTTGVFYFLASHSIQDQIERIITKRV
jgi:hypothetical protein